MTDQHHCYLWFSNAAANTNAAPVNVFLADYDNRRIPVLVTAVSEQFNGAPKESAFVGRLIDTSFQRLTDGDTVTAYGQAYCADYDIEPTASALKEWAIKKDTHGWFSGFERKEQQAQPA